MFDENNIERETSNVVYNRGKQLHRNGNVQSLDIIDMYMDEQKCERVKAFIKGSSWRCYNLNIVVDYEHGKIMNHECDCPAHDTQIGLCKHCVAVLLRYIQVKNSHLRKLEKPAKKQQAEEVARKQEFEINFRKEDKSVPSGPKTDIGLYRILMGNGLEHQLQFRQNNIRHRVRLEPVLHYDFNKWSVEFRIGISHMYVLKDIYEFALAMKNHEQKKYGAKLELYHHESAFTSDSMDFVNFIMKLYEDNRQRNLSSLSHFYINDSKRQVPLMGDNLDAFFELLKDREFLISQSIGAEDAYRLSLQELFIPMKVTGVSGGVQLDAKKYDLSRGSKYQYILDEEHFTIHRVSLQDIKEIDEFREYMARQSIRGAFVAQRELPVFTRDLLPELLKHYDIKFDGFEPEEFLPDEVKFELYLDMPELKIITCNLMAVYGDEKYPVFSIDRESKYVEFSAGVVTEKRNVEKEMEADMIVSAYLPQLDEKHALKYLDGTEDEIYEFLTEGIEDLAKLGDIYVSDNMKRAQIMKAPKVSMGVSLKSNLLELSFDTPDMSMSELTEILAGYDRKKKYFRLKSGAFVDMNDAQLEHIVTLVSGFGIGKSQLKSADFTVPAYRALYLDSMTTENDTYISKDESFLNLIQNMKDIEKQDYVLPESLEGIMREYQKAGFKWLETLHHNGFGGILADDMGLGKTLQVISFLLAHNTGKNKSIIVCPASLVYNWESEIKRFAPDIRVAVVAGDVPTRQEIIEDKDSYDVWVTSYDLLKRDVTLYESTTFFAEIIDEAQFIKNQNTQAAKAVKLIKAGTRFALTGTPMENRLSELWSIFDYLMPGFLYSYRQFRERIEIPAMENQNSESMEILRKMINPFILRRLKKEVLKDLPDKVEEIMYAKLEGRQQELYVANASKLRATLNHQTEKEFKESKIQILAELTKLRQICCNPSLCYENYKGDSAKTEVCIELIKNAIENGHKILVFSQFTSMLELLMAQAKKEGISFYVLTGQTSKEDRITLVDSFNKDDTSVFFISLKAGGTGLNLTSADIVIHFDPWWNVAAQNQATDRTHRIGQRNVVTVYKLIAKGTIEERILELQERKQALADKVLGGGDMDKASFTREELMELLTI